MHVVKDWQEVEDWLMVMTLWRVRENLFRTFPVMPACPAEEACCLTL